MIFITSMRHHIIIKRSVLGCVAGSLHISLFGVIEIKRALKTKVFIVFPGVVFPKFYIILGKTGYCRTTRLCHLRDTYEVTSLGQLQVKGER